MSTEHATSTENTTNGKYVRANGIDIYYEEYGSGEPLLLLHGGLASVRQWTPRIISAFAEHFKLVALDSRGHGRSKNTTDRITYHMLADDTVAFMQALGLRRPMVCGYSDGGQTGLEMDMNYPGLVKAYVIHGSTYQWPVQLYTWLKQMGIDGPGIVDTDLTERNRPGSVKFIRQYQDPAQGDDYWKTYLRQASFMWAPPLHYSDEELRRIVDPMLLFAGDRDDFGMPIEDAVHMYRTIAGSELAVGPGRDHGLPWSSPEMFTYLSLDYLLRHKGDAKSG